MKKQQIEDVRTMVIDSRDFFEVDGFSTYSLTVGGEAAYEMHSCTQEEVSDNNNSVLIMPSWFLILPFCERTSHK